VRRLRRGRPTVLESERDAQRVHLAPRRAQLHRPGPARLDLGGHGWVELVRGDHALPRVQRLPAVARARGRLLQRRPER
jgi:hypothetical protein